MNYLIAFAIKTARQHFLGEPRTMPLFRKLRFVKLEAFSDLVCGDILFIPQRLSRINA